MDIGMIGLGKMGGNMAQRLLGGGHRVVGFDPDADARETLEDKGGESAESLQALVGKLEGPRAIWMMVPSGEITNRTVDGLLPLLDSDDIVIDGGNSNYKDTMRRAERLADQQVHYVDCGTSGGIWGLREGYGMMIGGDDAAVQRLRPIFETLAPARDKGWGHVGKVGSGHFVKMVHNGIEYGMMQAYAEGFALMAGRPDLTPDLGAIGETWRHASVVRSWLLDLTTTALQEPGAMDAVAPVVADSGEGRWTVDESIRQGTPVPVIAAALMARFSSQGRADNSNKLLSLMRKGFGGHATVAKG
jgi:6-phosphogluconate dehydrogenase